MLLLLIFSSCFIKLPVCTFPPQGERSFFLQPGEYLEQGIQDVYVLSEEEGLVLRAVEAFNDTEEVRTDGREQEERRRRHSGFIM